jgi:hypothetical protein
MQRREVAREKLDKLSAALETLREVSQALPVAE